MTTPDPTLAARMARLLAGEHESEAESGCPDYEDLDQACGNAYRANQLITTAEADARVEAAVLAEREAVNTLLDDYPRPVTMHWHADKSFSKLDCCTHGHSMCEDCTQCLEAAIRSRGVTG